MENLFKWAREADQPLRTYSTGLLGGAMENQDIAANYRDENSQLVRTILDFFFFCLRYSHVLSCCLNLVLYL